MGRFSALADGYRKPHENLFVIEYWSLEKGVCKVAGYVFGVAVYHHDPYFRAGAQRPDQGQSLVTTSGYDEGANDRHTVTSTYMAFDISG